MSSSIRGSRPPFIIISIYLRECGPFIIYYWSNFNFFFFAIANLLLLAFFVFVMNKIVQRYALGQVAYSICTLP